MPAPIYIGNSQNPYGQQAMNYLSQLALQKAAHNMRMKEREIAAKERSAEKAKEINFKAAMSGSDVFRTDAEKPPEGYVQNPWDPTSFISPKPQQQDQFVDLGEGFMGIVSNGKIKSVTAKPQGPYKVGQIQEFKEGNKIIYRMFDGQKWVDTGKSAPRYKPQTNITVNTGTTKKTKGELEGQILDSAEIMNDLSDIRKMTKPEYLTWGKRAEMKGAEWASKSGLSDEYNQDLSDYIGWKKRVETRMLRWRKFITGVAGGPAEMKRIESTTLNVKDSWEGFNATLDEMKRMSVAGIKRADALLKKGFDIKKMSPEDRAMIFRMDPLERYEEAPKTAPPAAIEHLRQNPHLSDQFKEKYGYVPKGL